MNSQKTNEPNWVSKARWSRVNRDWLRKSAAISIRILFRLKEQGRTQKELADVLGITPQQVNKFAKGQENLTLETICKLENALGVPLIEIPGFEGVTFNVQPVQVFESPVIPSIDLSQIHTTSQTRLESVFDSSGSYITGNAA